MSLFDGKPLEREDIPAICRDCGAILDEDGECPLCDKLFGDEDE